MEGLEQAVDRALDEHRIPSVSVAVRIGGEERLHLTRGAARLQPRREAVEEQPYDLASITKALAGASVAAALWARGALDPASPVRRWLGHVDPRVTVGHLLTHSSGMPAWNALYRDTVSAWGTRATRDALVARATRTPLEADPGARHVYTDLGYLTLLAVLERAGDATFEDLFRNLIQIPAAAWDLRWGWPGAAATEQCPVRGALIEGTVHDLNCAAMGGVSTHAGLFGTARGVATLGEALLAAATEPTAHPQLPGTALARLWKLPGPGSHVGGWDTVSPGYTSTGRFFPADTVGHLGFTGTSIWLVPSRAAVVVLLTNRVHPVDERTGIRAARPLIHDAIATSLGWS